MKVRFSHKMVSSLLLAGIALAGFAVAAQAADKLIPIRVSLGDVSLNKLIFVVAKEAGIYEKNGLDVDQFITPGAADTVRRSGVIVNPKYIQKSDGDDVQIAIGGGSPTMVGMTSNSRALPRILIASTDNRVRWRVITDSKITSPEQLKGKRLGYSGYGAMTHFMAILFAKEMGWDPDKDISLMSNALNVEALKLGHVDAFVGDEIAETMAVTGGFKVLVDLSKYNLPIAGSGINPSVEWLKNNRDAAGRFVKSAVEAIAMTKQHPDVAYNAMAKWYGMTDPEKQKYFYREMAKLERKPYPAVAGIKKVMEVYNYHEMTKHKVEDFYDDSFVKELDQSGYIDSLYK
jgi:NitT/TauT family transport system substrate-binding protein